MNMLNVQRLFFQSTLLAILVGGCATLPPKLAHPKSSGLAIDMRLKAPIGLFTRTPDQVYLARIDGEDDRRPHEIIPSNYSNSGRAYLLNARPGTNVAVAAVLVQRQSMGGPSTTFTTYFSKELVEQTRVTVREAELSFMGAYVVDNLVGSDRAEGVETDYGTVFLLGMMGDARYRGVLLERRADEQARNEFFRKAKEDLAGSGWAARLK